MYRRVYILLLKYSVINSFSQSCAVDLLASDEKTTENNILSQRTKRTFTLLRVLGRCCQKRGDFSIDRLEKEVSLRPGDG
jgi:hypothetical protein